MSNVESCLPSGQGSSSPPASAKCATSAEMENNTSIGFAGNFLSMAILFLVFQSAHARPAKRNRPIFCENLTRLGSHYVISSSIEMGVPSPSIASLIQHQMNLAITHLKKI
uniref:Uncharacterized protein n=1 Tax=Arundo donax TaxID=35708 RepID=A0A0A8ZIH1_ARUDO